MLLRKPGQLSNPRFVAWPSVLSLAAEQSIEVGSRIMDPGFVQVGLCGRRACSEWACGLSLATEQSIEMGSKSMDFGFVPIGLYGRRTFFFRVGKLKAVSLFSCGLCCFAVLLDR